MIEHLFWPKDFLIVCNKILIRGGLLILTTPNIKGFDLMVLNKLSDNVGGPNHLNYFHAKSLKRLLKNSGFEMIELLTPGKLDAELVRKKILSGDLDVSNNPFIDDKIQVMPKNGYTYLFKSILKGIEVWLNKDFFDIKDNIEYNHLIYCGCIDEFFNYCFGKLSYRSLYFETENYDKEFFQNWVQVNYPNDYDYTRIVEVKHITKQKCSNTTIVIEYPLDKGEPYYPIPNKRNHKLYQRYKKINTDVKFIGRLGKYEYLNMDQVVKQSLDYFYKIKNG